jgi:dihydroorotate dehydrogenase (NAD+) catalytic subunit
MTDTNMRVNICGVEWKNPVTTAAGTFNAKESGKYYAPSDLGAVTTKGIAPTPWTGNPLPRIAETYGGMLNSVGLENPGVDAYIAGELAELKSQEGVNVIANVAGHSPIEFCEVVEKLDETDVDMLELNVSCPNLYEGGAVFGTDERKVADLTREVKKLTSKPVIVKLSPNVTDIVRIAEAAEDAGADALSLINTLVGMRIDIRTRRPILANGTGGLSGPAIKPVAIAMVYRVCSRVSIPVIGMGGIMTGEDAYEFLIAGASAVAVGTAALVDPYAPARIVHELEECYAKYKE